MPHPLSCDRISNGLLQSGKSILEMAPYFAFSICLPPLSSPSLPPPLPSPSLSLPLPSATFHLIPDCTKENRVTRENWCSRIDCKKIVKHYDSHTQRTAGLTNWTWHGSSVGEAGYTHRSVGFFCFSVLWSISRLLTISVSRNSWSLITSSYSITSIMALGLESLL